VSKSICSANWIKAKRAEPGDLALQFEGARAEGEAPIRKAELSKAAGRIGDVVELITTIAGQTNLLAQTAFTKEVPSLHDRDYGFFAVPGYDGIIYQSPLYEKTQSAASPCAKMVSFFLL
jgi:hypothetical protein